MKAETKYKGSIKLSAIGDALGWITEFERTTQSLKEKYGVEQIDQFYPWKKKVGGRFYGYLDSIKVGSYSDDTQLLLAVARSIGRDGRIDNNYFAKIELPNWLDYARGGGRTVKTAANKISRKSVKWFSNFYNFKINDEVIDYKQTGANGAAMRVLPIALANLGDPEKIKEEIFCNCIITHGHPRAILGAMLYGYAVNQIISIRPEDFNWENYVTFIGRDFSQKFELNFLNKMEIRQWLQEWNTGGNKTFETLYNETISETQNQLRLIYQSIKQNDPVQETLHRLGCFEKATRGSGIVTVVAGIYLATKFHNKPLQAIIESVNALGSDTDSIAAFAGGLIGALHGQNIIPDKWKTVQDIAYLDGIAERLLAISEDRLDVGSNPDLMKYKLLNSPTRDDFEVNQEIEFIPLGKGKISFIDRQSTLTKGKYNLIIEATLESGQSIIVTKLFDRIATEDKVNDTKLDVLLKLAVVRLKPKAFETLMEFVNRQSRLTQEQIETLIVIIKNEN